MGKKMLIDAAHPEETRVVVVSGNRIEEFDYESAERKQLKGSIFLAKVTRVEPSLQAAFVDYGGNRHGFLAFNEIHPDYYQIPVADRQALLEEEKDEERASDADEDAEADRVSASAKDDDGKADTEVDAVPADEDAEQSGDEIGADATMLRREMAASADGDDDESLSADAGEEAESSDADDDAETDNDEDDPDVDSVGAEDVLEEVVRPKRRQRRVYKIQEVIKRRQVILVQVVKEERGNKGAALTTYLSLAGRYCVLMPNTARGGGISRKITDSSDRKRLKEVAQNLDVPEGTGLIVRTAGAQRTKTEIKRDFDYLLRLWETVRNLTLESTAPSLVYEEGNLIKRSIRDLYTKDVDEVWVEGEAAHKEARDFMKMLMPSHARNVKLFKETRPLFSRYPVEAQLDKLFSPVVTLQSGGYLVINQTEALVSIDINSGKATREHNIEDTALKTNIEAAEEIARQLRLRDLAGLIVIDFIDMEEKRNNRTVERKLKEALKNERARIQVGRISHFGLLEMSRQRLRQGMLENSTRACPHCEGTGLIRSISSCALSVLRSIEDHLISRKAGNLTVHCNREVAFYILNEKRLHLMSLESSYGVVIFLEPSDTVLASDCEIQRGIDRAIPDRPQLDTAIKMDESHAEDAGDDRSEASAAADDAASERSDDDNGEGQGRKRRRRRGRRGGRKSRERDAEAAGADNDNASGGEPGNDNDASDGDKDSPAVAEADSRDEADAPAAEDDQPKPKKRARRSRKKAAADGSDGAATSSEPGDAASPDAETETSGLTSAPGDESDAPPPEKPKRQRRPRKAAVKAKQDEGAVVEAASTEPEAADAPAPAQTEEADERPLPANGNGTDHAAQAADGLAEAGLEDEAADEARGWTPPEPTAEHDGPPKRGWWSRR